MNVVVLACLAIAALFLVFYGCEELGYRFGRLRPQGERPALSAIDTSVLGLLGLLLAFAFGGGLAHLDQRRQLIVNEVNAIGTAYKRLDLLSPADRAAGDKLFGRYLDARIAVYQNSLRPELSAQGFRAAQRIQDEIWKLALVGTSSGSDRMQHELLLLPALNTMFDAEKAREEQIYVHTPAMIFVLLVVVAMLSCLIAGFTLSETPQRYYGHMIIFALMLALTIYTVIDLDYPRFGLIRVDALDRSLHDLRATMP